MVRLVIRHSAHLTHTHPVSFTEHLQRSLVLRTHPAFQVLHRIDQLVSSQACDSAMRLQVSLTVGGQTHQAGLQGVPFGFGADVTRNISWLGSRPLRAAGELLHTCSHLRYDGVDVQLRSAAELLFAHGTFTPDANVPVFRDAALAEVVPTWYSDWLSEHVQADGAQKVIFREETAGCGHV